MSASPGPICDAGRCRSGRAASPPAGSTGPHRIRPRRPPRPGTRTPGAAVGRLDLCWRSVTSGRGSALGGHGSLGTLAASTGRGLSEPMSPARRERSSPRTRGTTLGRHPHPKPFAAAHGSDAPPRSADSQPPKPRRAAPAAPFAPRRCDALGPVEFPPCGPPHGFPPPPVTAAHSPRTAVWLCDNDGFVVYPSPALPWPSRLPGLRLPKRRRR